MVEYTLVEGKPRLYHERWEIETHLMGRHLTPRSKTPELVELEIEGLMLAHYVIRHFLHKAACAWNIWCGMRSWKSGSSRQSRPCGVKRKMSS